MSYLTFLDIEDGLKEAVYSSWLPQGKSIVSKLKTAVKDRDENGIADAIDKLNFTKATVKAEGKVEALMAMSLVYGAHFAGGTTANSVFTGPSGELPDQLNTAAACYMNIFTQAATQYIKREATKSALECMHVVSTDTLKKAEMVFAEDDVVTALNNAVLGNARMMSDIAANLSTSRLVSYGFLAEAKARGIVEYQLQAVLDKRTSKVCRHLNGRTFKVETSFAYLDRVLQITDPEELKVMAPFVKSTKASINELENMSDAELQARGIMVPPFHPNCRT